MNKKWMANVMKILLLIAVLFGICAMNNQVSAVGIGDIFGAGSDWISKGSAGGATVDTFVDDFIVIGQILVSIGTAIILVVGVIMAAKWIVATPDQQAKLKQQLIGLAVAIVVLFGAVGIWTLARNIMSESLGG